jgi:methionyl-tRNA formyltransferase
MPDSDPQATSAGVQRLGFAGTPEFAAGILQALLQAGRTPVVVYTQPDRPVGRGRRLRPSPVKSLAEAHGLPVRQPASLRRPGEAEHLAELDLDALVVVAYGLILPPPVLEAPRYGCINVHASLLPRWRGAAPVERAILAGDTETGVCIMRMDAGLDTGPVYQCRRCPITRETDAPALEGELGKLGQAALLDCLARLPALTPTPQPETGVTYAHKLTRADAEIRWQAPADAIERQVRALAGRLAPFAHADGARVSLLAARALAQAPAAPPGTIEAADRRGIRVACGEGVLELTALKLSIGKGQPLSAADAVNGYRNLFAPGKVLGDGTTGS